MLNKEEIEKRISSTNEAGLVTVIYEAFIDNCEDSIIAMDDKEYEELNYINNNSRDILAELLSTLKGDSKLSNGLRELYIYINELITTGENKKDKSYFEKSIEIIKPLEEAFKELEEKIDPKVLTGLTYGKSNLNEYQIKGTKNFKG